MLARSDHLVCTFSSNVCRLIYERMQTLHSNASKKVTSLDTIYYNEGLGGRHQVAIYAHKASRPEEISMEMGDILAINGNHWDGYSKVDEDSTQFSFFFQINVQKNVLFRV